MDYLARPDDLNKDQKDFLIEKLAEKPHAELEIKELFDKLFAPASLKSEVIVRFKNECKDLIKKKREEIYVDQISSLPMANSFPIIAVCQSRVEELLKTPKITRTVRRLYPDDFHIVELRGREYMEEIKEIDDTNIQNYIKLCQAERFNYLKLEISRIVNEIDKQRIKSPPGSFKPIEISTGFETEDAKEEQTNS